MAKLTKKSIAAARKKVSPGQWQKRGLKTAWVIQKRGQKGGKRKSPAKKAPARKRSGSVAKASNPGNKKPKIGASYQAVKGGVATASPLTDGLMRGVIAGDPVGDVRNKMGELAAAPLEYGKHALYMAADGAVDNRMQQSAAISGGSATAILPELYLGLEGYNAAKGQTGGNAIREAHRAMNITNSGYDPAFNRYNLDDSRFRTYQALKRVGQAIRFARSKVHFVRRFTEPLSKFASMFGGRI